MKKVKENIEYILAKHKKDAFVVVAMCALYLIWSTDYIPVSVKRSSFFLWLETMLFIVTLFTIRKWRLALSIWLILGLILIYVNFTKSDLIHFPITELDLVVFAKNPVGFFDSLGVSRRYQLFGLTVVILAVSTSAYKLYNRCVISINEVDKKRLLSSIAVQIMFILISYKIVSSSYLSYGDYVYEIRSTFLDITNLSSPDMMISASQQLTALGFVSYSHSANKQEQYENLNRFNNSVNTADKKTVLAVASNYLPVAQDNKQLPNIVFILAESMFDPNAAFLLEKHVSNTLFNSSHDSVGGIMHVSAVGGGTWKTEFETITGVDLRFFGIAGEYTHISLSPYVKKSFTTYLTSLRYDSRAFYPVWGSFYGAKNAYKNYGFERFYDADDLKLEKDWKNFSDERMAEKVIAEFPNNLLNPFFYYVVTLEGHSPYPCVNYSCTGKFPVTFKDDFDFVKNCSLNEYLIKASSTEKAYIKIVNSLREIEKKTGRPFIAVIFGDHQPHEFNHDQFDTNRSSLSRFYTFYKIVKSDKIHLPVLEKEFHATLLPTIISTALASDSNHIYLPENLYIYEKCGSAADLHTCPEISVFKSGYEPYIMM